MLTGIKRIFKHPKKAYNFALHQGKRAKGVLSWHYSYATLRKPKVKSWIDPTGRQKEIMEALEENGVELVNLYINVPEYRQYVNKAGYHNFPNYFVGGKAKNFVEKSLEHFLAAKLLNLSSDDTYVDVASSQSPAAEIYHRLYGCKAYRQDILFTKGMNGNVIGGDAANMPVADGFATKMALHCSFEHFEGDSDARFIKEASRILKKGGKLCILPLYFFNVYAIQTDLAVLPTNGMTFEEDAILYCSKGWGNRHGRFYDIPHFITRIRNNQNDLTLTIHVVQNEKEVDPSCYIKFIGLFEKV